MPDVKGFRAFRYALDKVGSYDRVLTPPYDVISAGERETLAGLSPYNLVHVLLPQAARGIDRYEAAAQTLERWIAEGALKQDGEDSFYLLEQRFENAEGKAYVRRGFFGVAKLPETGEKTILGHERTFEGPAEDRLRLLEATKMNIGPIFVLYADPDRALAGFLGQMDARQEDMRAATMDGVEQRIWRVAEDPAVGAFLHDKRLYIADGHHRFQTACAYRDRMRAAEPGDGLKGYDYVLLGFVAFSDPGLLVLPPHRLVDTPPDFDEAGFLTKLARWFEAIPCREGLAEQVRDAADCALGLAVRGGGRYLLKLRDVDRGEMLGTDRSAAWRSLDVAVLHRGIIERILGLPADAQLVYERDAAAALAAVERGEHGLAFILNATRPEQVRACAHAGEPMPQKSTYFYPKLPSGAVVYGVG